MILKSQNNFSKIERKSMTQRTNSKLERLPLCSDYVFKRIFTKEVEMHFIEIPKFKNKNPNTNARIEQWLWLLAGEEEKIKMAEKKNKEVKKAVEELDEMSMDKAERERYEAILKAEFNYNTSMYNMKEEGKKEEKIEIAKELLKLGMTIEDIQKVTKLTIEEIKKLN